MERQQTDMLAAPNKNNIDCQNHNVLRHTFSVTAIQKGISIRSLQEVLDHKIYSLKM
jgi:site-specific recombinase XerD